MNAVCQGLLQSFRVWAVLGFEHAGASTTFKHAEHMMLRRDLEQVSDAFKIKTLCITIRTSPCVRPKAQSG